MRTRAVIVCVAAATALAACSAADPPATAPATAPTGHTQPSRPGPPATSRPPAPAEPAGITLAFTGDMLVSDELRAQAARNAGGSGFDFGPMLREVAPVLRDADWAVCHQETPISADNRVLSGWPSFSAPVPARRGDEGGRLRRLHDRVQPHRRPRRRRREVHIGHARPGRAPAHRQRPLGGRVGPADRLHGAGCPDRTLVLHVRDQRHHPADPVVGEPHRPGPDPRRTRPGCVPPAPTSSW